MFLLFKLIVQYMLQYEVKCLFFECLILESVAIDGEIDAKYQPIDVNQVKHWKIIDNTVVDPVFPPSSTDSNSNTKYYDFRNNLLVPNSIVFWTIIFFSLYVPIFLGIFVSTFEIVLTGFVVWIVGFICVIFVIVLCLCWRKLCKCIKQGTCIRIVPMSPQLFLQQLRQRKECVSTYVMMSINYNTSNSNSNGADGNLQQEVTLAIIEIPILDDNLQLNGDEIMWDRYKCNKLSTINLTKDEQFKCIYQACGTIDKHKIGVSKLNNDIVKPRKTKNNFNNCNEYKESNMQDDNGINNINNCIKISPTQSNLMYDFIIVKVDCMDNIINNCVYHMKHLQLSRLHTALTGTKRRKLEFNDEQEAIDIVNEINTKLQYHNHAQC